jgi:hypothetical protein
LSVLDSEILDIQIPDDRDRFALCGGPYSNFGAVAAFLDQTMVWPHGTSFPQPEIVPLSYDPQPVVAAMAVEGLPSEFQESLLTGIWTTCAEILPDEERQVRSRRYALDG